MLWGRSGNICAFPECKKLLVADISETDDPSVVGAEAHIVARKPDWARGTSGMTARQRDSYNNLILLCGEHHKIIDDNEDVYTVGKLQIMKNDHEDWVKETLHIDGKKQYEDEVYASYVDELIQLGDVVNWLAWTSYLLSSDQPQMRIDTYEELRALIGYIASRVWFKKYPALEYALINFKNVLNDLLLIFDKYSETTGKVYSTKKIYQDAWDEPEKEDRLLKKYQYHVDLVEDLTLELTRAANYIFDKVREFIFHAFRMKEGVLMVQSGPHIDFTWKTHRPEYKLEERIDFPYPGLREFMTIRADRLHHWGEGVSEDYFLKMY